MQGPVGVIDLQAFAQGIQRIALAGIARFSQRQRIDHLTHMAGKARLFDQLQLVVEKAHVKRRIVDDDFVRPLDKVEKLLRHIGKYGLVCQKFGRDAVHRLCPCVNVSLGVEVQVQIMPCGLAIDQFHTADFDDAVAFGHFQPGGFGIEKDLTHDECLGSCRTLQKGDASPHAAAISDCLSGFLWRG